MTGERKREWARRRYAENKAQRELIWQRKRADGQRSHPHLYRAVEAPGFHEWYRERTGVDWDPSIEDDPEAMRACLEVALFGVR